MRPNQQNRRMRGRGNNNNRKGPNPLTRSYESNGPDVKIRGSAQQIADKYTSLARDAQSSGDRVMAENYLQHAEHYNRVIAAALAQTGQQMVRDVRDDDDDGDDEREEGDIRDDGENRSWPQADLGSGPQPVIEGIPVEVAMSDDNRAAPRAEGDRPQQPRDGEDGFRRNRRNRRNRNGQQQRADGDAPAAGDDGEGEQPAPVVDGDNETAFEPA